jgi:hypothetical protein
MADVRSFLAICPAALLLAACGGQPQPSTPAPPGATASTVDGDRIGIAECDEYLDRYESCLATTVPESARDALRAALQQTRTTWRKSLSGSGGGEKAMIAVCQRARAAVRPSMAAYGCTDF